MKNILFDGKPVTVRSSYRIDGKVVRRKKEMGTLTPGLELRTPGGKSVGTASPRHVAGAPARGGPTIGVIENNRTTPVGVDAEESEMHMCQGAVA